MSSSVLLLTNEKFQLNVDSNW